MNAPRKHHYVPSSYLANFAGTGGRMHVLDLRARRQWASTPEKSACERDFYALEVTNDDEPEALAVEGLLAHIESRSREAIETTLRNRRVPDGELQQRLMDFLAVQAVRVPGVLQGLDRMADQIGKRVAWYLTATPETWAAHVGDAAPDVPFDQLRDFVLSEDFALSWDQNTRMRMMLHVLPRLAMGLSRRKWTVVHAPEGSPDFVCSDCPLTVAWNEPPAARWMPAALGLWNTTAHIPLGRRSALVGMFEGHFPTAVATPLLVGIVNMWTVTYATRFVYSAEPDFHVVLPDGTPGGREAVLRQAAGHAVG